MNQRELPSRLALIGVVTLVSLYLLIGTFRFFQFKLTTEYPNKSEVEALANYQKRDEEVRKKAIRFGLDIQGGADVLMSVDLDELRERKLKKIERDLRKEFRAKDVLARPSINEARTGIVINLRDEAADQQVLQVLAGADFTSVLAPVDEAAFLRDKKNLTVTLREDLVKQDADGAVTRTVELLRERIDALGLLQPSVVVQGADKIRIQLPGETHADRAVDQITRLARLEFRIVADENRSMRDPSDSSKVDLAAFDELNAGGEYEILPGKLAFQNEKGEIDYHEEDFIVQRDVPLGGEEVETASALPSPTGGWEISLAFTRRGMSKFGRLTTDNVNRRLAIVLDGWVRSAPNLNEPILQGRASITGSFTRDEAATLSRVINTGALPVKLKVESSQVIGARLGTDSINASIRALGLGALFIVVFMCAYYGRAGMVAVAALAINVLAIMALLVFFGGTLTLSGVGGILLTLGMAVDANVLIYERIREELFGGKRPIEAIAAGFDSAFYTIVDANLTTLITALILLQFGQGSVQGFALTMTFGIFATLFTGLYVTRTLFGLTFEKKNIAPLGTFTLFRHPTFDFIGKRKLGYAFSGALLALGLASVVMHGGLIPGTEFTGGVKMQVEFLEGRAGTTDVKKALRAADPGLDTVQVVEIRGSHELVITSKLLGTGEDALQQTTDRVEKALSASSLGKYTVDSRDLIGNEVGGEFTQRAVTAIIFASIGILLYVAVRFEFWFGVAAVIALLHDVLITLGILTILNTEITLEVVAALLVVIGYSINDTIVIFDRVRENARLHMGQTMDKIINMSINESLNRTTITSATTLIAILAMLLFGGYGLKDFSLTLFIGIITGTYSSSFVAAPILSSFARRKKGRSILHQHDEMPPKPKPAAPKPAAPKAEKPASPAVAPVALSAAAAPAKASSVDASDEDDAGATEADGNNGSADGSKKSSSKPKSPKRTSFQRSAKGKKSGRK